MKTYFITGTDTDVGKTYAACALLAAARERGLSTAALKPVASGCARTADGLRNDDALRLLAQTTAGQSYAQVNPVALEPAIAPHIAAQQADVELSLGRLLPAVQDLQKLPAEFAVVEGAGGWLTPLNERESLAELAAAARLPVILVVGMRLGCLNHALLTAAHVRGYRLPLAGWIANCLSAELPYLDENLDYLREHLGAPLLGVLPYGPGASPEQACRHLDIEPLLSGTDAV
ncbi:MAG: dethiobiotin synthase [Gammaproteobacteria bacterium]|nr:dethiobiotin synthase [Gammaproteobacteria bacterium]